MDQNTLVVNNLTRGMSINVLIYRLDKPKTFPFRPAASSMHLWSLSEVKRSSAYYGCLGGIERGGGGGHLQYPLEPKRAEVYVCGCRKLR